MWIFYFYIFMTSMGSFDIISVNGIFWCDEGVGIEWEKLDFTWDFGYLDSDNSMVKMWF